MEFGLEGAESEEVSGFPLEEAEVSEQPSERVLGEGLEWKEHAVALVSGSPYFLLLFVFAPLM